MRASTKFAAAAVCAALVVGSWSGAAETAEDGRKWEVSYAKALADARKQEKLVLADFTGSDWCPPCMMLKKEVFDTDAFKKWARQNVILLELDFPQTKAQPDAIREQNENIKQKYGVQSFPTVLFLDGDGEVLGRSAYLEGGSDNWIKAAEEIIAGRPRVRLQVSLSAGLAAAKKADKPLLIFVADGKSKEAVQAVDRLLLNIPLAKLEGMRMLAVRLDRDASANGGAAERAAVAELFKRHKIGSYAAIQIVLVDPEAGKVLHRTGGTPDGRKLAADLKKALPKIEYGGEWLTDMDLAKAIADQDQKLLVLNFTGSDWDDSCALMKKEVFDTDVFKKWAKENVVLVELDFPQYKPGWKTIMDRNRPYLLHYGVQGVPTVLFARPSGEALAGYTSYQTGLADMWMQEVRKFVDGFYKQRKAAAAAEKKTPQVDGDGVIRLKNGKTIRGQITMRLDDSVLIEREDGSVDTVKKSDLAE